MGYEGDVENGLVDKSLIALQSTTGKGMQIVITTEKLWKVMDSLKILGLRFGTLTQT